ncbi:MAG: hypothetical protein QMD85_01630 [Candidatus Aenigmarchaeota archaeon]|nr:hypothetical protein [Candidatus Aenigmarchaeota archaeon]MDI6722247.1 hypothetical protein [Candidatus Aenigmarchaeota archaeon]
MLGFLKRKKKEEMDDFFDIKSTIAGTPPERDVIEQPSPRQMRNDPFGRPVKEEQEWAPPFPGRKDVEFEDFGTTTYEKAFRGPSKDYDVMQRLDVIESQLQAIRSQTETINERLKNLEFRLAGGRRY